MNPLHVAHIIRDVFNPTGYVVCYGTHFNYHLADELRKPEHGIETFKFHSTPDINSNKFWFIPANDSYYGFDFANLVISIDYNFPLNTEHRAIAAIRLAQFLKPGGKILLVNPGNWATELSEVLNLRTDLQKEIQRYQIFKNANVKVLQR